MYWSSRTWKPCQLFLAAGTSGFPITVLQTTPCSFTVDSKKLENGCGMIQTDYGWLLSFFSRFFLGWVMVIFQLSGFHVMIYA